MDSPDIPLPETLEPDPAVAAASTPFVGRWIRLVSTTNWEKGRIICEWREALIDSDAPATEYSDEAWSLLVGGVSSQHVGRLRRVWRRFGADYETFEHIYWSHFFAALDWDDAELWLEGAVQNGWSVSQMRRQRWEAHGAPAELRPRDEDIIVAEQEEDVADSDPATISATRDTVRDPSGEEAFGPDFGDESPIVGEPPDREDSSGDALPAGTPSRPFAELPEMPEDLAESFQQFKLAILRHKTAGWREIARDDVVATLDALKELALAES